LARVVGRSVFFRRGLLMLHGFTGRQRFVELGEPQVLLARLMVDDDVPSRGSNLGSAVTRVRGSK
jgi:hypothetical protein